MAQPVQLRLSTTGGYLTNAYLDSSEKADAIVTPEGTITVYPAEGWLLGYQGRLDWYSALDDLTSHGHDLYAEYGPRWSSEEGLLREVWVRLALQTLFNADQLENLDHLTPRLLAGGTFDLSDRISLTPAIEGNYRSFINDSTESQVNAYACAELGLHLPSRTTVLARPCYGFRWYFQEAGFRSDEPAIDAVAEEGNQDSHQVDLRLRLAQNLSRRWGVRLEYLGRLVPRRSERAETIEEIGILRSDLSSDFRYHRHRPSVRLSWLVTDSLLALFDAAYERREYDGIDALDQDASHNVIRTEENRLDDRLMAGAVMEYRWRPTDELRFTFGIDYSYTRIWSTADIYTSQSHEVMLTISADWVP